MKERIDILFECSVINKEIAEFMYNVIDFLDNRNYSQEKLEVFITHLAMASQRIFNNEETMQFDDEIWNSVENSDSYQNSLDIYNYIKEISPVVYPKGEERFILLHLCNLESY